LAIGTEDESPCRAAKEKLVALLTEFLAEETAEASKQAMKQKSPLVSSGRTLSLTELLGPAHGALGSWGPTSQGPAVFR